jgi:uncharacterized protein (DUF2147 family)
MIWRAAAMLALLPVSSGAVAEPLRSMDGVWLRDDGNARVRIAPCGSELCATNLWIKDTSKGEEVGDRLIMSLGRKSDSTFAGTAYDPKRDRSYSLTVIVGHDSLTTRGCILGGLLCKGVSWVPAN